jgi:hypothetical protein
VKYNQYVIAILLSTALVLTGQAEERLEMEGTAIIGNQELPKVLYIVPWKPSELPDLSEPPLGSLIDDALAPIDREEFRREVLYHDALATQQGGQ